MPIEEKEQLYQQVLTKVTVKKRRFSFRTYVKKSIHKIAPMNC